MVSQTFIANPSSRAGMGNNVLVTLTTTLAIFPSDSTTSCIAPVAAGHVVWVPAVVMTSEMRKSMTMW